MRDAGGHACTKAAVVGERHRRVMMVLFLSRSDFALTRAGRGHSRSEHPPKAWLCSYEFPPANLSPMEEKRHVPSEEECLCTEILVRAITWHLRHHPAWAKAAFDGPALNTALCMQCCRAFVPCTVPVPTWAVTSLVTYTGMHIIELTTGKSSCEAHRQPAVQASRIHLYDFLFNDNTVVTDVQSWTIA